MRRCDSADVFGIGTSRSRSARSPRCSGGKTSSVAYDEELAHRIRELVADEPDVAEKRMFGGLAFLIGGNMFVAASGQGGLMVRVEPKEADALLARPHARPFEMHGREMRGWLRVDPEGLETEQELEAWVRRGFTYAVSLPAK